MINLNLKNLVLLVVFAISVAAINEASIRRKKKKTITINKVKYENRNDTVEPEFVDDINENFNAAATFIRNNENLNLDDDTLLKLYALYKQATVGICNISKPSLLNFTESAKWEAWSALKNLKTLDAKLYYIELVENVTRWKQDLDVFEENSTEKNLKPKGMVYVSTMFKEKDLVNVESKTIFDFCKNNDLEKLENHIKQFPEEINILDEEGMSILHWASDRGNFRIVKFICENDNFKLLNAQDNLGQTALHLCVISEQNEVVEYLKRIGADQSIKDHDNNTIIDYISFNSTKIIISSIDSVSNGKDFYSSIKRDSDKFFVDDEKRAILANGEPANYLSVTNSGFLVPSSLLAEGTYNQTVLGVGFVPTCRSHKTTGYITINETGMEILKGFTFPDSGYTIMPASVHSNSFVYPKLTVFQQSRLEVVSQGLNSNKSLIIDALLLTSSANKDQINDDWYPEGEALNSNEDNKINSIWAISCKFQSGIFQVSLYQSADEFYANSKNNALLVESEIFHSNSISKHFSTMPLSHLSTDDMLKIDWLDETALPNEWRNKDYVVSRASFQNYLMRAAAIYLGASVNPDFKETYIKQTEGLKTKQEFFIVFSTLEIIITPIILCLLSLLVFFSTLNKKFTLTATEKSLLKRDHFFFMSLDKVLEHFGDGKHIIELIDSNSISKNLTGKQIGSNESLMEEVKEYTK